MVITTRIVMAQVILVWIVVLAGLMDSSVLGYLVSNGLNKRGEHVCEKEVSRKVSYQTRNTKLGYKTYKTRCPGWWNWFGWRKCTTKKTVTTYHQTVAYKQEKGKQLQCCDGWNRDSNNKCATAVCTQSCVANQGICVSPDTCRCIAGWTGKSCSKDINECGTKNGKCKQICSNTLGSFECSCRSGYKKDASDNFKCEDIDECMTNKHNCHGNANCTNTAGSFNCTCQAGYLGDGVTCKGIRRRMTTPLRSFNSTNTSAAHSSLLSQDNGQPITTASHVTTAELTAGSVPTTRPTQPSHTLVTLSCSGYIPGPASNVNERTELLAAVTEKARHSPTSLQSSNSTLSANEHGFSVTMLFNQGGSDNKTIPSFNKTAFKTIYLNHTISCAFAKAIQRDAKKVKTTLKWQTPVFCTAGVALFILIATLLVILRAKRQDSWITLVHAPYFHPSNTGHGAKMTSNQDRRFAKVPLLDSEDDEDFQPVDMA